MCAASPAVLSSAPPRFSPAPAEGFFSRVSCAPEGKMQPPLQPFRTPCSPSNCSSSARSRRSPRSRGWPCCRKAWSACWPARQGKAGQRRLPAAPGRHRAHPEDRARGHTTFRRRPASRRCRFLPAVLSVGRADLREGLRLPYAGAGLHSRLTQRSAEDALSVGLGWQKTLCCAPPKHAPVAQLDRVLVSEAKGHRFDSCRARQSHMKAGTWLQAPASVSASSPTKPHDRPGCRRSCLQLRSGENPLDWDHPTRRIRREACLRSVGLWTRLSLLESAWCILR